MLVHQPGGDLGSQEAVLLLLFQIIPTFWLERSLLLVFYNLQSSLVAFVPSPSFLSDTSRLTRYTLLVHTAAPLLISIFIFIFSSPIKSRLPCSSRHVSQWAR